MRCVKTNMYIRIVIAVIKDVNFYANVAAYMFVIWLKRIVDVIQWQLTDSVSLTAMLVCCILPHIAMQAWYMAVSSVAFVQISHLLIMVDKDEIMSSL